MRPPSIPKEEVLERLTDVFRRVGYEGATLSELSKATGLHRASLYHYFPGGKEEMAHAVLDDLGGIVRQSILEPLQAKGDPQRRLKDMMKAVDAFYAGGKLNCLTGLFALSSAHDLFHIKIGAAIEMWVAALATVAIDAGVKPVSARMRAENWLTQLQGALIMTRGMGNDALFKRVLKGLPEQILGNS
jgi:TetR/AcrR family transcriptional regulator, lmrAB and yxaGH operons repressor